MGFSDTTSFPASNVSTECSAGICHGDEPKFLRKIRKR